MYDKDDNFYLSAFVLFQYVRTLMVLLLCLAFIGQATASAVMSYQMMNMSMTHEQISNNVAGMAHSDMMDNSHHMAASEVITDTSEDCCQNECNCYLTGCTTVATLPKSICHAPLTGGVVKISSLSPLVLSQSLTSLYRPPILS